MSSSSKCRLSAAGLAHSGWLAIASALQYPAAGAAAEFDRPRSGGEPELQEIIVTASLRRGGIDALPASVTVIDEQTLRASGARHLQDVLGAVPNLNWASGTSRPRYFQLRGIGETEQWQGAPNPSVGLLIDGMDFSGVGGIATLSDVARVDVLRGPQATALGANALAGLVSIRSRAPQRAPEARLELGAGDFGSYGASGVFGGPLGADAAWRAALRIDSSDGFTRNHYLRRDDTNGLDERSARVAASWAPADVLDLRLTLLHVDLDNGYDAFTLDNSRNSYADQPGRDAQRSNGASLLASWRIQDAVELQSTSAWTDSDIDYGYDGDWGFDPDYDFTQRFERRHRTLSQDLRVVSSEHAAADRGFDWVAGLYTLQVLETNLQTDRFGGELLREPLASRYRASHLALYAQGEWQLRGPWSISLGLRGERRGSRYRDSDGADHAPSDRMLGGQFVLERRLGSQGSAWLSASRGYKAGGFNIGVLVPAERRLYDPEFLDALEAGWRHEFAAPELALQAVAFSMRRRAQQVSTSVQLDPGDPLSFIFLTDNAASGRNEGLELSARWGATRRLRLEAALGLLRTRYEGYRVGERRLDGREQAHAPEYQLTLAAEWRDPRGWFLRAESQSVDDFYFSDTHEQRSSAYTLVNLRLGLERERWSVALWARNLFDAAWTQRGFYFGNEPPDFPDRLYVQPGDPRRFGASLSVSLY